MEHERTGGPRVPTIDEVRATLGSAVRRQIVGRRGLERQRMIAESPGPRWFGADRPIRGVHADASMFIGGLRALLLQSLHPLAMAGVAQHSDYRHDPWGRLQRTADFLGATTFGTIEQAEEACAIVHRVHRRVEGTAADGRPYAANDPHLLLWVHITEVDSFLVAHDCYGERPLGPGDRDGYVADMAVIARQLGAEDPPVDVAGLRERLAAFRSELRGTPEARVAARFLLNPPVSLAVRAPYTIVAAAAVGLLPWWSRLPLRLPILPVTEAIAVRPAARAITGALRWALTPESAYRPA